MIFCLQNTDMCWWIPCSLHEKSTGSLLLPHCIYMVPWFSLVDFMIFKWFQWNSHGIPWMQWGLWESAQLSLSCPRLRSQWQEAIAQGQLSGVSGHCFACFWCDTMEKLLVLQAKLVIFIDSLLFAWKMLWINWNCKIFIGFYWKYNDSSSLSIVFFSLNACVV